MKKNLSSILRQRLTLQQEIRTPDGAGGYVRSWQDVANLWAEVRALGNRTIYGREKLFAGMIQSEISHMITIRYHSAITTDMRFILESRVFNIRAIYNVSEQNQVMELLVEEGVAG